MQRTDTIIVGAGQAGLAVSNLLTHAGRDHVLLERGRVGERWRSERWESLQLLTPNWMTRLPGWEYDGDDPDGYLSAGQVADLVAAYAVESGAPVVTGTTVTSVRPGREGFEVETDRGRWRARTVVLAAGATRSVIPVVARRLPHLVSLSALQYRNPDQLPPGGVLVVGASASGVQIADELQRSGRPVTLSVGEHVRVPRTYRGRDILWWLDSLGVLDERWDEMDDVVRARHLPSLQLVGGGRTLDLNVLQATGVRVVGRLAGIRDGVAQFSGALPNICSLADLKLNRLHDAIDEHVGGRGERPEPTSISHKPPLGLPLASGEIRSVVWATGLGADFSWLDVPIFDHRGRLLHDGGVTRWPGLYVLGLPLLRRRRSTYIDGARLDVADLAAHLTDSLQEVS